MCNLLSYNLRVRVLKKKTTTLFCSGQVICSIHCSCAILLDWTWKANKTCHSLLKCHYPLLYKSVLTQILVWSYPEKPPFCGPLFLPHSSQGEATTRMCNSPSLCSNQPVRHCGESIQPEVLTTSVSDNNNGGLTGRLSRIHSVTSRIFQTGLIQ